MQISKSETISNDLKMQCSKQTVDAEIPVWVIRVLNFEFVSNFQIRVSDFFTPIFVYLMTQ